MTGRKTTVGVAGRALLPLLLLLLTGCGIKTTGVIESGHAAAVKVPGGKTAAVLYFVSKDGSRLVPVPFAVSPEYTIAPDGLVGLLLSGPHGAAEAAGLTTALPKLSDGQTGQASVSAYSPARGLTVRVPFAVGSLSEMARKQLVCTVGLSVVPDTVSPVTLQGTDTALPSADCEPRP